LVNLVEDWSALERYAGDKQGLYRLYENEQRFEIRVQIEGIGFKKEFENGADELLLKILNFCRTQGYLKVCQTIGSEAFFR
jgi:hypothetical protein